MQPDYWAKATKHLTKHCPTMGQLIRSYKGEYLTARGEGFYTLVRAVAGQQISVKAAEAIWRRMEKAVDPMTPQKLLRVREATLKKCGLSQQKVDYVRNVARFFRDNNVTPQYWSTRSDEQIITELTSIKGIGTWTAEMFLIFHLARPNVFPVKDLGVLKAIDLHYTGGQRLKPKEYIALAEQWHPYKSVATWYLWRALDPIPVAY